MSLHDCPHTFEALATTVFPAMYDTLLVSLSNPIKLADFSIKLELLPKLAGCYVVLLNELPS
jgi:hypothetical protein